MALGTFLVGEPCVGGLTDVHDSARNPLGTKREDEYGNEYIYLLGLADIAVGTWVVINNARATALAVADLQGPLAVAKAAVVANKYGWFQIYGDANALVLSAFDGTNGIGAYLTATPGSLDDTDVAGDAVQGAVGMTDRDTTTGLSRFILNYPHVSDHAFD
jgi:hypothetical protein